MITLINGITKTIVQTSSPQATTQEQSSSPLTQTQTIAIAVVAVVLLLLLLIFGLLCIRKRRKNRDITYRPDMYQSVAKENAHSNLGSGSGKDVDSNETHNNLNGIFLNFVYFICRAK